MGSNTVELGFSRADVRADRDHLLARGITLALRKLGSDIKCEVDPHAGTCGWGWSSRGRGRRSRSSRREGDMSDLKFDGSMAIRTATLPEEWSRRLAEMPESGMGF